MTRRGLTLIELIIAIAVFAIAAGALVITLRNGLRTWQRVGRLSDRESEVRFALALLGRDAAHAVQLTGPNDPPTIFDAVNFSVVTVSQDEQHLPQLERVLVRGERLPDGTTALVRRTAPYPAAPDGPLAQVQVLLPSIATCRFAYLVYTPDTGEMTWEPQWGAPDRPGNPPLPRGVRLTLQGGADWPETVTRVYEIPVGWIAVTEAPP